MTCALENDFFVDAFCVPDPNESRGAESSLLMPSVCLIKTEAAIYIWVHIYTKGLHT